MGMTPPRTCKTNNVAENDVSDAVFFLPFENKTFGMFNFIRIQFS